MAQENIIKKKGKQILAEQGYVCWCGAKTMYHSSDIFGIFDVVAVKTNDVNNIRFIQWTSKSNISARRKKIKNFFLKHKLFISSELWGFKNGKFTFETIKNPL